MDQADSEKKSIRKKHLHVNMDLDLDSNSAALLLFSAEWHVGSICREVQVIQQSL